uniref:Transposase n=1 Tax=Angiostrongylus cantonensis TaxID=6313 RepID=A0A0K0DRW8_ANGCA
MLQFIIAGALIFEIIRLFPLPDASTVKYTKPTVCPFQNTPAYKLFTEIEKSLVD